jgi:hypothetical protein
MKNQVIMREKSTFRTVLFRHGKGIRWVEPLLFMISFAILREFLDPGTTLFKIIILLIAIMIIFIPPIIFLIINRPQYVLSREHLTITMKGKEEVIPLSQLKFANSLKYIFVVGNRRISLMVSDDFLAKVRKMLENQR